MADFDAVFMVDLKAGGSVHLDAGCEAAVVAAWDAYLETGKDRRIEVCSAGGARLSILASDIEITQLATSQQRTRSHELAAQMRDEREANDPAWKHSD